MDSALVEQTSQQFLLRWKRLVSTTNWDKGQIIHAWRSELMASGSPAAEYSDEAWSRRVANVTPQHVGRLRRAYERFHETSDSYPGLFWSHFQAALDWDDAEMWLEGAVQNQWSISEMRAARWQALGQAGGSEPADDDDRAEVWDEDQEPEGEVTGGTLGEVRSANGAGYDADDDEPGYDRSEFDGDDEPAGKTLAAEANREPALRPFADLPPLPADVNDAFEAYKLCILRHKLDGWREISRDDLVSSLDSLKVLALQPAEV